MYKSFKDNLISREDGSQWEMGKWHKDTSGKGIKVLPNELCMVRFLRSGMAKVEARGFVRSDLFGAYYEEVKVLEMFRPLSTMAAHGLCMEILERVIAKNPLVDDTMREAAVLLRKTVDGVDVSDQIVDLRKKMGAQWEEPPYVPGKGTWHAYWALDTETISDEDRVRACIGALVGGWLPDGDVGDMRQQWWVFRRFKHYMSVTENEDN